MVFENAVGGGSDRIGRTQRHRVGVHEDFAFIQYLGLMKEQRRGRLKRSAAGKRLQPNVPPFQPQ